MLFRFLRKGKIYCKISVLNLNELEINIFYVVFSGFSLSEFIYVLIIRENIVYYF